MKRFRFLLVVLGLFALIGFSRTVQAAGNPTVTVNTVHEGGILQSGPFEVTDGIFKYNASYLDYEFNYWVIDGYVRTDLP